MTQTLFLAILLLSALAFLYGRTRGASYARAVPGGLSAMHSRPVYHGAFVASLVGIPAILLTIVWLLFQETVIESLLFASLPADVREGVSRGEQNLLIGQIKAAAGGVTFGEPDEVTLAAAKRYLAWRALAGWAMVAIVLGMMALAFFYATSRLAPRFRARHGVERVMTILMVACASLAILTTVGIVASLLYESLRFFARVPANEFLFGTKWDPQIAIRTDQVAGSGAFGAIPVFSGTILIATIAMLVAIPIGLLSAIYLNQYASAGFRSVVKPILEILAGIPTVVYGFFAILVVAPALRDSIRWFTGGGGGWFEVPWDAIVISPNSALAAGAVMGIMIIPFISSLSDDALNAVPRAMKEGSLAMGATENETITKVLLPAALPGIMGGILLGVSRAIGETMIVVMAAGLLAKITANPFEAVTTVTVQIVTLLTGDTEFDNPKTLAAFALGLVLFAVTLVLNVLALRIVRRYRERYE